MYKLFGHFKYIIFLSVLVSITHAKSFESFRNTNVVKNIDFKTDKDATFNGYLQSGWDAYESKIFASSYKVPKPQKIYPLRKRDYKLAGPKIILEVPKVKDTNLTAPLIKKVEQKDVLFDFFGSEISFNIPHGMKQARFFPQTQKGIENYFGMMSISQYHGLIKYISMTSQELRLNDWGKYLLVKRIGEKIFSVEDDRQLFTWFIFNKLGYSVRVGLRSKHVSVMYNTKQKVYATPYYTIGKDNFYTFDMQTRKKQLFTYKKNFPMANKKFDLSLESLPKLEKSTASKSLEFEKEAKKYAISFRYNTNIIDFMATYPQADYEVFFNAPMESQTYSDIVIAIKKIIDTKRASEGIDFLLSLVQKAFTYEVDSKQFAKEKVMFAQETVCYDKSDSDDRAVLFSYFMKKMLSLNVVGLRYKDHMATALYIPMPGDNIMHGRLKYVVADPTYIDASIGQSMAKYRRIKPQEIITVTNK